MDSFLHQLQKLFNFCKGGLASTLILNFSAIKSVREGKQVAEMQAADKHCAKPIQAKRRDSAVQTENSTLPSKKQPQIKTSKTDKIF